MKPSALFATLAVAAFLISSLPSAAAVRPYVRVGWGANQLRLTDLDASIQTGEEFFRSFNLPADFKGVGNGYGPQFAAGLRLLPALRVGATYSFVRATRENSFEATHVVFEDIIVARSREVGAEAEFRFAALRGVGIGGEVAQSRVQYDEYYGLDDHGFPYQEASVGSRTLTTYGAYLSYEQTNANGVAGFVRVGFRHRPVGRITLNNVDSDGVYFDAYSSQSLWMDYSGLYMTMGTGFDFGH